MSVQATFFPTSLRAAIVAFDPIDGGLEEPNSEKSISAKLISNIEAPMVDQCRGGV